MVLIVIGSIGVAGHFVPPIPLPIAPTDLSEMVEVPGGSFGVAGTRRETRSFYIDRFEVTVGEWRRWRAARGLPTIPPFPDDSDDEPLRMVTYYEAVAFANDHFKRLPTNLEWERASHGQGDAELPWGSGVLIDAANTSEAWGPDAAFRASTTRVGTFESGKSACGAYDMVGNVWEWTSSGPLDLLHSTAGGDDLGGSFALVPFTGERFGIVRGGAFNTVFLRGGSDLERLESLGAASFDLGFRCVIATTDVELQKTVFDLLKKISYRDPLRFLVHTLPAMRRLKTLGKGVLPYLERTIASSDSATLRERADEVRREIEGGS